jgi:hypothetical protein
MYTYLIISKTALLLENEIANAELVKESKLGFAYLIDCEDNDKTISIFTKTIQDVSVVVDRIVNNHKLIYYYCENGFTKNEVLLDYHASDEEMLEEVIAYRV